METEMERLLTTGVSVQPRRHMHPLTGGRPLQVTHPQRIPGPPTHTHLRRILNSTPSTAAHQSLCSPASGPGPQR